MRNVRSTPVSLGLAVLAFLATGAARAEPADRPARVLGMHVESLALSPKDRGDLFQVVQAKLKRYPSIELLQPPDAELTDLMMELECIDVDVECLQKLGTKYTADTVFYIQVDRKAASWDLLVRVVSVRQGAATHDKTSSVTQPSDLANALEKEVEVVYGPPPAPKANDGALIIKPSQPGAKVYLGEEYLGAGDISVRRPPGDYTVRVTKEGFEEAIAMVTVKVGKKVTKLVDLKPLDVMKPIVEEPPKIPEVPTEDEPEVYETWWFWTAIGGGVLVAVAIGVGVGVGTAGGGGGGVGALNVSVERDQAWKDAAVQGFGP